MPCPPNAICFALAKWASAIPPLQPLSQRVCSAATVPVGPGRGTGVDDAGLQRKQAVIDAGLARHAGVLDDPLGVAMALGGRELAALLGATLAARHRAVPVLLDGFVCTAAVAPLARLAPGALDHTVLAHLSAEAGHRLLAEALGLIPLLNFGMRLGEASAAALAVPLLRAAVACHTGMATFDEAAVANRPDHCR